MLFLSWPKQRDKKFAEQYAVADAKNLSFGECELDLVVAYNVLMDVEDVPATLQELKRVMKRMWPYHCCLPQTRLLSSSYNSSAMLTRQGGANDSEAAAKGEAFA